MIKFRALLSVQLKAMLSTGLRFGRKNRAKAFSTVGAVLLVAALSAYLSGIYSFLFASQLAPVGQLPLLFLLMPVLGVILGTFFTVFSAQSILFGGRDNDLMLSLPISPFLLMLSRTLALYLENLLCCLFVLLPAGGAWLWFGGGGGFWFALRLLPATLLLALVPTLLALVCGFLLAWLGSRLCRKTILSLFAYGLFLVLVFLFVFRLNGLITQLALYSTGLQAAFSGWGLPFLLLQRFLCYGDGLALAGLAALTLLPFLAAVWLFGRQYRRIVTGLTARSARSDYTLAHVNAMGSRRALLSKEARRFFGSPIYLFNTGLGLLLLLAGGVAALLFRTQLLEYLRMMESMGVQIPLAPALGGTLCLMLGTVAITSSSISLEGKQLWILKEAPIAASTIFGVKIAFQLLLTLPCLSLFLICTGLALSLPLLELVTVFLVCILFSLFTALLGLLINLFFPRLDAPNDAVVVKQSAASFLGTFGGMIMALLLAGLWMLLRPIVGDLAAMALCGAACIPLLWLVFHLLRTTGLRRFAALG